MNYNITHDVSRNMYYEPLLDVAISEHRWYLGERLGRSPTDSEVRRDWIVSGNAQRFLQRYQSNKTEIIHFCHVHEEEGNLTEVLTPQQLHEWGM